ncbi:isoleucine--tRNA ligase [Candidatus Woesearchaeota archaeon]|nr:isoleucine--tRNA ligase [Candidatus Woesearchaeota archaeon]
MANIGKFDFVQVEKTILSFWQNQKIYDKVKDRNKGNKKFYFLQGPPYTSGDLHAGQAWNHSLKDMILRYKRMNGFDVWDRAGYDMHGLSVERRVLKNNSLVTKDDVVNFGVEKFTDECYKFSMETTHIMTDELQKMGVWLDFSDPYLPVSTEYIEGIWWLVKKADEQNRLYEGLKVMTWCYDCETACAKHELEYENVKEDSVFLKFKLKDKENEYLIVWTTTPWTIPYNLAVMVNPGIEYVRAKVDGEIWIVAKALAGPVVQAVADKSLVILEEFMGDRLEGLEYIHPLQKELGQHYDEMKKDHSKVCTVILTEDYCDTSAGSGLVHTAPGCGPEDFEACQPYDIPPFNNLQPNGFFPGDMGKFSGWHAKKDEKKFLTALEESGCLIAVTPVEHEYPHCQRCHFPVVFRLTKQWFFKTEDLKTEMIEHNKGIHWVPQTAKNAFDGWLKNLRDNSITKQRFWGTPVPVWVCDKCNEHTVVESRDELIELAGTAPENLHIPHIDKVTFECECGGKKKRIPDVMDVWIDAGTACWNCLDFPRRDDLLKKLWPADFILEGKDQIRGWFNVLMVCSTIGFRDKSFNNVYMHGFLTQVGGEKMSKSLGNIILPKEISEKVGSDALRLYFCRQTAGIDINFSWDEINQVYRNLIVLWNLHKYLIDLAGQLNLNPRTLGTLEEERYNVEEKFMISKLHSTIKKVTGLYEEYRLDEIPELVEELFLELSRTYVQLVREKATIGSEEEKSVVVYCLYDTLMGVLKMMSPMTPFIAEMMYQNLKDAFGLKTESLHLHEWPKSSEAKINKELENEINIVQAVVTSALALREKIQIGRRWPIKELTVETTGAARTAVEKLSDIIINQANVKTVKVVEKFEHAKESARFDYSKLSPDFGELSTQIIAALTTKSPTSVIERIRKEGKYEMNLNGEIINILQKHLMLEKEVKEPHKGIEFKYGWIYLNTEQDPVLLAEGFAREIVRNTQSARKKSGLQKADKIDLFLKVPPTIYDQMKEQEKEIGLKTGAVKTFTSTDNPKEEYQHSENFKIKGEEITVFFNKL